MLALGVVWTQANSCPSRPECAKLTLKVGRFPTLDILGIGQLTLRMRAHEDRVAQLARFSRRAAFRLAAGVGALRRQAYPRLALDIRGYAQCLAMPLRSPRPRSATALLTGRRLGQSVRAKKRPRPTRDRGFEANASAWEGAPRRVYQPREATEGGNVSSARAT